jgi:hypothetical protein
MGCLLIMFGDREHESAVVCVFQRRLDAADIATGSMHWTGMLVFVDEGEVSAPKASRRCCRVLTGY